MLVGSQTRILLYQVHIVLRQDDAIVRVMIIHGYGFKGHAKPDAARTLVRRYVTEALVTL